jgi:hypothetical protein
MSKGDRVGDVPIQCVAHVKRWAEAAPPLFHSCHQNYNLSANGAHGACPDDLDNNGLVQKQTTAAGLFAAVKGGGKMTLINIIVILILVGLALWLVNTYIPMAASIKSLLNVVVFVVVLIWLLQVFGLIGPVPIRIPPLK